MRPRPLYAAKIDARMTHTMREQLEALSVREGRSVANLIREAVDLLICATPPSKT